MLRNVYNTVKYSAMTRKRPKDPLLVVLGATGTGKSQVRPEASFSLAIYSQLPLTVLQLAVDLATRFNGEIINGDAMQMYDGLPIITNKITSEEQNGIPHHLLGFIALDEEPWRVGLFKKKAGQIIREIRSKGRLPILVGGTHYYTQSLLFEDSLIGEDANEEHSAQDEITNPKALDRFSILDGPTEAMLERLREVDPVMADRWHPNERRKIRRSLEIFLTTGKKASDIYAEQKESKTAAKNYDLQDEDFSQSGVEGGSTLLFWVHSESETLKKRLDARVDKMMVSGLLDEVKSMKIFLQKQSSSGITVDRGRGIWVSIGWKEFESYLTALESGTASKEKLQTLYELSVEQTKAATRQYAKRQVRWIRLKLMSALSEENALDKLFLLDGSDVTEWANAVSNPAIGLAESFLEGTELSAPRDLCPAAAQMLALDDERVKRKDLSFHRECELCNTLFVVEEQWETHLKSRRHRAQVKRQKNAARRRSYLEKSQDVSASEGAP